MKRFGSLFLAGVLGSVVTLVSFQWVDKDDSAKVEYISNIPSSKVAYTVDENGQVAPLDFTSAAEKVMPAVVYIRSTQSGESRNEEVQSIDPFRDFFGPRGPQGPSQSSGSGVIISEGGYIVTNNHVVQDAEVVEVTLYDNRTFKADVIGTDP